jgi:hypothetical protein
MCAGKVQDLVRIGHVLGLWNGYVLYSIRGHNKHDVSELSVKLLLAGDQFNLVKLHLQRRMDRARWRHVCKLCSRKVQGINRIGHVHGLRGKHVLWSIGGHINRDVQQLSVIFRLAYCKQRTDRVHM